MKTFETFQKTRRKMSVKDFNEASQSDVEEKGVSFVYSYQNFTYIHIYDNKSIGFPSQTKKYGLIICNEYYESDNLEELEVKLYNDWFIDNLEGSEEWLYKVGYHTPKHTPLYYKMFQDMNLDVEDISYKNDIVDSLRLYWGSLPICDVLLPNSATQDWDNEKFDTFNVHYLDKDGERYDGKNSIEEHLFHTIDDLEDGLIKWFHQMARDFMEECELDIDNPMSLDEFLIEHKATLDGKVGDYNRRGTQIVNLHNDFKPLKEYYKFGCEPKNMFEDGVEAKDDDATREFDEGKSVVFLKKMKEKDEVVEAREYMISFLQKSHKAKELWLDSEIKNIPNLSFEVLKECYNELKDVEDVEINNEEGLTSIFRKLLDNYDDNMINKVHFIKRMKEEIKIHS
jgi:hypothetical protein